MNQDDIEYVLDLLTDAIKTQDWDLIEESKQYLEEFIINRKSKYKDEDE